MFVCFLVPSLALAEEGRETDLLATGDDPVALETSAEELRPSWSSEGLYFITGFAPASTLYIDGFNPGLRYDFELGMHWTRRRTAVFVGAEGHVLQYFGRKAAGGGADGVLTVSQGPAYARVGAGVMTGIPGSRDVQDFHPAMGGLAGIGLQGRAGDLVGRIGVDYDVRMDTTGRVNQTVLLSLRFVFGF